MLIRIPTIPASVTSTVTEQIQANAAWGDNIAIDASARNIDKIGVKISATPYQADAAGNPVAWATSPVAMTTGNAVGAAANIPSWGEAIVALQTAIGDTFVWMLARQADLVVATATLDAAQEAATAATTDLATKSATRQAAFSARSGETDPDWIAADAAWTAAKTVLAMANQSATTAQVASKTAQAAAADPANPPLVTPVA